MYRRIDESPLNEKKCSACEGETAPLDASQIGRYLGTLRGGWTVVDNHHLFRSFRFPDFSKALEFTNRVGMLSEAEGHHPDILVGWGKAEVTLWTHAVDGLTLNDFILASKISDLEQQNA